MTDNIGSARVGERVIKFRLFLDSVCPEKHIEEKLFRILRGGLDRIYIHLVLTIVRAKLDHVLLIGDDVDQLILAEETLYRGERLSLLLPNLDRDAHELIAFELKT